MHYIVFDLEWNIASRATPVDAKTQAAMPFEIIEIGAVKLNEHYEIVGEFTTHVRPKIYKILSSHIAAVTRRFQQSLKFGLPFPQAAQEFFRWCSATGDDYALAIWSESDPSVLRSNLAFHGLPDTLPLQCLDVQHVFDDIIEQSGQQRSIEYAVDFLRLPKTEPFHQAVKDAWYTGRILQETARIAADEQGLTDLLGIYAYDPNLNRSTKISLDPASSHEAVLHRLASSNLTCPACETDLQTVVDWQRQGNRADARFSCVDHGPVVGKARFRTKEKQVLTDLVLRLEKGRQVRASEDAT
ncbi:MAG: exonuclease domain-containing protein [Eubacteriales bacterium]|nr:exonuclease domain-containing protein [Eubacteriales bacterium]